jgi:hypothetical protein
LKTKDFCHQRAMVFRGNLSFPQTHGIRSVPVLPQVAGDQLGFLKHQTIMVCKSPVYSTWMTESYDFDKETQPQNDSKLNGFPQVS